MQEIPVLACKTQIFSVCIFKTINHAGTEIGWLYLWFCLFDSFKKRLPHGEKKTTENMLATVENIRMVKKCRDTRFVVNRQVI